MKKFLLLLAMPFMFAACNLGMEDVLLYGEISFGEVVSGKIITDVGNTYIVTTDETGTEDWKTAGRCVFDCDILTKEADGLYNVRLLDYSPVVCQDIIPSSEISKEERGDDGVYASQIWISGPGINACVYYTSVAESNMSHEINLVLDEERSTGHNLYFILTHNGHGETYENEDIDTENLVINQKYFTFDYADVTADLSGSYYIFIESDWYVTSGNELLREKETISVSGVVSF